MNQEKIGKFIAQARKKEKMTQEELAEKLGFSNRTISRWENGKSMPDVSSFEPLCKILGITINELLKGEKIDIKTENNQLSPEPLIDYSNYLKRKEKNKTIFLVIFIIIIIIFFLLMMLLLSNKTFFKTVYNSEFLDNVNIPIPKYTYYRGTSGMETYITKLKTLRQPDEVNINIGRYLSTLEKFEYNNETYYYDKSNDFTTISYRINNDGIGFINTIYITYGNGKAYSE